MESVVLKRRGALRQVTGIPRFVHSRNTCSEKITNSYPVPECFHPANLRPTNTLPRHAALEGNLEKYPGLGDNAEQLKMGEMEGRKRQGGLFM